MILGGNILLLETKGRQSGKIRKVPLTYAEIDNGFIVAASYGGRDKTPNWFYNLENSNTFVTVDKDRLKVELQQKVPGTPVSAHLIPVIRLSYCRRKRIS